MAKSDDDALLKGIHHDDALLKGIHRIDKIAKAAGNPPQVCIIGGNREEDGTCEFTIIVRPPLIDEHLRQHWLDAGGDMENVRVKIDIECPEKEAVSKGAAPLIKKIASMKAKHHRENEESKNRPLPNGIKTFNL